jgi:hypothetical protein
MNRFPRGSAFSLCIALALLAASSPLHPQEEAPENGDWDAGALWDMETPPEDEAPGDEAGEEDGWTPLPPRTYEPLPRVFRNLALGMGLEDLKETLREDSLFHFRGDRDVSFLPAQEQSLVETTGPSFIRRAFFQLQDGALFVMAFSLDTRLTDHYSIFMSFVEKYGEPALLDPRQAVWETEDTRIAIERPLTVKYIDKRVFNNIIDESAVKESGAIRLREEFINGF